MEGPAAGAAPTAVTYSSGQSAGEPTTGGGGDEAEDVPPTLPTVMFRQSADNMGPRGEEWILQSGGNLPLDIGQIMVNFDYMLNHQRLRHGGGGGETVNIAAAVPQEDACMEIAAAVPVDEDECTPAVEMTLSAAKARQPEEDDDQEVEEEQQQPQQQQEQQQQQQQAQSATENPIKRLDVISSHNY